MMAARGAATLNRYALMWLATLLFSVYRNILNAVQPLSGGLRAAA
jgi:hypothetical protein